MLFALLFFFNDTATTEIYTLSLHDALPIYRFRFCHGPTLNRTATGFASPLSVQAKFHRRSEEHTSELQSRQYLVCRLLLEKKKKKTSTYLSLKKKKKKTKKK